MKTRPAKKSKFKKKKPIKPTKGRSVTAAEVSDPGDDPPPSANGQARNN